MTLRDLLDKHLFINNLFSNNIFHTRLTVIIFCTQQKNVPLGLSVISFGVKVGGVTVLWTTRYYLFFLFVKLRIHDKTGYPIHRVNGILVLLLGPKIFSGLLCYKGSPYSTAERTVLELIPVLGSQPAGDVSHIPGGRLPLLSCSYPRSP